MDLSDQEQDHSDQDQASASGAESESGSAASDNDNDGEGGQRTGSPAGARRQGPARRQSKDGDSKPKRQLPTVDPYPPGIDAAASALLADVAKLFKKRVVNDWKPLAGSDINVTIGEHARHEIAMELGWALVYLLDNAAVAAYARNRSGRRTNCHIQAVDIATAAAQLGITGIGLPETATRGHEAAFGKKDSKREPPARRRGQGQAHEANPAAPSALSAPTSTVAGFQAPAREAVMFYQPPPTKSQDRPVPVPKAAAKQQRDEPPVPSASKPRESTRQQPPAEPASSKPRDETRERQRQPHPPDFRSQSREEPRQQRQQAAFRAPDPRPKQNKDRAPSPAASRVSRASVHTAPSMVSVRSGPGSAVSHHSTRSASVVSAASSDRSGRSGSRHGSDRTGTASRSPSPRVPAERRGDGQSHAQRSGTPTSHVSSGGQRDPGFDALRAAIDKLEARRANAPSISALSKGKGAEWILDNARSAHDACAALRAQGSAPDAADDLVRSRARAIGDLFAQAQKERKGRNRLDAHRWAVVQQARGEWASW